MTCSLPLFSVVNYISMSNMLVVYEVAGRFVRFGKNMWFGSVQQIPGSVDHHSEPDRQ
jgi:hypothetical protein